LVSGIVPFLLAALLTGAPAHAYSQFTHEELIDLVWADSIQPLLLEHYPSASDGALRRARAFAYGGSLVQDIGYYPFGNRFFSNLAHYVRSGDFVVALFRNARSLDELAFATGALSHYIGDSIGHGQAVNPSTAIEFPDLNARYGSIVTYEEAPIDHIRTEFGFDVAQSVLHRYAPNQYRERFGFRVARPLLYRAFREIYGISARGILGPARSALSTYRWSVTRLLPAFLGAQEVRLGGRMPAENPDGARSEFLRDIGHAAYSAQSTTASGPGVGSHVFAVFLAVVPKIGKLKALDIKPPVTATEDLFLESTAHAAASFRAALGQIRQEPDPRFELENLDLDTGSSVAPGQSKLVDGTYDSLVLRIVREQAAVLPELRAALARYYSARDLASGDETKRRKIEEALTALGIALR